MSLNLDTSIHKPTGTRHLSMMANKYRQGYYPPHRRNKNKLNIKLSIPKIHTPTINWKAFNFPKMLVNALLFTMTSSVFLWCGYNIVTKQSARHDLATELAKSNLLNTQIINNIKNGKVTLEQAQLISQSLNEILIKESKSINQTPNNPITEETIESIFQTYTQHLNTLHEVIKNNPDEIFPTDYNQELAETEEFKILKENIEYTINPQGKLELTRR